MDTANITGSTCLTLYRSEDLPYHLFIKVKVLIFVFKLYTGALTGVWTGAVSLSPWITQRPVSRTMLHYLF